MTNIFVLYALAWGLLLVGLYGLMTVRNLLRIIIALQLMAKGGFVMLIVAGVISGNVVLGESLALAVISVDTLVMVIGLALVVHTKQHQQTLNVDDVIHGDA